MTNMSIHNLSLFLLILTIVLIGIMVRAVWDEKVKLTLKKIITGALFIAVLIFAGSVYLSIRFEFVIIISAVSGLGCENLIKKYIKNKVWDKTDIINKLDGDKNA